MNRVRFEELLNRYEDNLATSAELTELAELLNQNQEYRRELVERKRIETGIHEFGAVLKAASRPSVRKTLMRPSLRKNQNTSSAWVLTGVAAAVVFLVGIGVWQSALTPSGKPVEVIARVDEAANVRAARSGRVEALAAGAPLYAEDSITVGSAGRMSFLYDDGTRLSLAPGSLLTIKSEKGSKRLMLIAGQVSASVTKQPAGQAMILSTSNAKATILGTQFKLTSMEDRTRLEVTEGVVRLTRSNDGQSVEVSSGRMAIAEAGRELVAGPIEQTTSTSELGVAAVMENFENGKTEGWEGGQLVQEGNAGSRHAIQGAAAASADFSTGVVFTAVRLPLSRLPGGKRENQVIFTYQPGMVIRFAYLLEGDAAAIRIQGFNNQQDDNFGMTLENPSRGKWAVAQFKLDDFLHNDRARISEKLKPGETFKNLTFFAGSRGQSIKRFLIDDVIIAQPSGGAK